MTTPLVTIADALIEFILSLLRDPAAVAEFNAAPEETLAKRGLADICGEDVRAVVPIIVDRPEVTPTPPTPHPPSPPRPPVIEEIHRVTNSFHIDNRSTIVDQSVNQNIWAEGDVLQIFDQEAVLAAGDNSVAAGNDAAVDNSSTDVTVGDVAIGNTETNTDITDSFKDSSTNTDVDATLSAEGSFNDSSTNTDVDAEINDSFQNTETTVTDTDVTVTDSTVTDSAVVVVEDDATMAAEEYESPDAGDEYVEEEYVEP